MDRSLGDIHPQGNPHYWLDPLNAKIIAQSIAKRLSQLSPNDSSYFQKNLEVFDKKIDSKMKEWTQEMRPLNGENIITYHKSWPYFAHRFGLNIVGELEPKPGIPPTPGHLKAVINIVNQNHVHIILNESIYKTDAAHFIASKTKAHVVVAPISVGGVKGANNYFSLIDMIVNRITKGLNHD